MALLTFSEVNTWLGFTDAADTTRDALLTRLVSAEIKFVQNWCGRDLVKAARTEYPEGYGYNDSAGGTARSVVFLNESPIVSVASVYVDSTGVFAADTLVDSDDYQTDGNRLILDVWVPAGRRTIKVTYTGGYDDAGTPTTEAVPEDLRAVIFERVAWRYGRGSNEPKQSADTGGSEVTYLKPVPLSPDHKAILMEYKRW